MAAEASRSGSSGAADSYVGSLISLTSKSEIRYEGILFNINTDEASIGLQNVRSFGTEGRRKDGPQVPAIDKVYEYIVFRGSDIKDLQVKSSPPVQTAPPVHNDPAIIQSHYTAPTAPSSLPSAPVATAAGPASDFTNQVSQPGVPITTYQNNVPMYPPGGNMPSWNPSAPPTTNVGGVSVPMYWQGYYGPSGSMQMQQQPLLRPIQSLSMPSPVQPQPAQQPVQYPTINSSLSTGASNISAPQSMEFPPALLQPIVSSTLPTHSNVFPVHSSVLTADSATNMMPSKGPSQVVSQNANSPLVPPVLSNSLDRGSAAPLIPNQAKPISTSSMSFNGFSESRSSVGGKSTSPALVTPGQFLQHGPTISQTAQIEQKDVEVVQVSSMVSAPQSVSAPQPSTALKTASAPQSSTALQSSTVLKTASASQSSTVLKAAPAPENQPPLLPLPSPSNSRMNGVPAQTRYINRGGRDRRRGNEFSHPVANFTEDFDFEAMNEKFKKDEVWGDLGKSKTKADDGIDFEDEVVVPKADANPVYKKDDFFDTLSCNSLDRESRNGRTRFSEQMRLDTETFGNFPRNRGFRGGRGPGGGRSRGGYYGRGNGYGYVGRGGRGGQNVYRAI